MANAEALLAMVAWMSLLLRVSTDLERASAGAGFRNRVLSDLQHIRAARREPKGKVLGYLCTPRNCHLHALAEVVNCGAEHLARILARHRDDPRTAKSVTPTLVRPLTELERYTHVGAASSRSDSASELADAHSAPRRRDARLRTARRGPPPLPTEPALPGSLKVGERVQIELLSRRSFWTDRFRPGDDGVRALRFDPLETDDEGIHRRRRTLRAAQNDALSIASTAEHGWVLKKGWSDVRITNAHWYDPHPGPYHDRNDRTELRVHFELLPAAHLWGCSTYWYVEGFEWRWRRILVQPHGSFLMGGESNPGNVGGTALRLAPPSTHTRGESELLHAALGMSEYRMSLTAAQERELLRPSKRQRSLSAIEQGRALETASSRADSASEPQTRKRRMDTATEAAYAVAGLDERFMISNFSEHTAGDESIGEGASSTVLVCTTPDGTACAAKVVSKSSRAAAADAKRELAAYARITAAPHAGLVQLLGVHEDDSRIVLLLELSLRGDLRSVMPAEDETDVADLSWADKVGGIQQCTRQLLEALAHLHSLNVAHGDIKPENLLLFGEAEQTQLKVADFGSALVGGEPGRLAGYTLVYAAPEARGNKLCDSKMDLWSVGILLFEMLSANEPYKEPRDLDIVSSPSARSLLVGLLSVNASTRFDAVTALQEAWFAVERPLSAVEPQHQRPLTGVELGITPGVASARANSASEVVPAWAKSAAARLSGYDAADQPTVAPPAVAGFSAPVWARNLARRMNGRPDDSGHPQQTCSQQTCTNCGKRWVCTKVPPEQHELCRRCSAREQDGDGALRRVASRHAAAAGFDTPIDIRMHTFRHAGGGFSVVAPVEGAKRRESALRRASIEMSRSKALRLSRDTTAGRIGAAPAFLSSVMTAAEDLTDYGINYNTNSKDAHAWDEWEEFCRIMDTPPLRLAEWMHTHYEREAELLGFFAIWVYPRLKPRSKAYRWAKPRSALAYPLALIRIFGRWGVVMPSINSVRAKVNGLMRVVVVVFGVDFLTPTRKEPFTLKMIEDIAAIVPGTRVGTLVWDPHDPLMLLVLDCLCFMLRTAFRLAELVAHASGELMYLTRSSISVTTQGRVFTDPAPDVWANMRRGDVITVRPPRSKTDQFGEIHCPYPCSLVFDDTPLNPAKRLRDAELRSPCRGTLRETTPLFTLPNGRPLSHSFMDSILRVILVFLYGLPKARLYSWHSCRVGLACALRAAGCPGETTQLICRWMCVDSLRVYALKGVSEHATWISKADGVTVDAVRGTSYPVIGNDEGIAHLVEECAHPFRAEEVAEMGRDRLHATDGPVRPTHVRGAGPARRRCAKPGLPKQNPKLGELLTSAGVTVSPGTKVPERQRLLLMARPTLADVYEVSPDVLAAAGLVNPPGEVAPEVLHIECVDMPVDVGAIAQPPARPSPPAPVGPMA